MRGDSLRDLYAKALALLGLALLAAVGALFDYWPVASELPRVDRVLVTSQSSRISGMQAMALAAAAAPVAPRARKSNPSAAVRAAAPKSAPVAMTLSAGLVDLRELGRPIALTAPLEAAPVATTTFAPPPMPISEVAWADSRMGWPIELAAAPVVSRDDGSAMGFVTDAFKKTGRTIVRTGVKTGASIRDALVLVGGAFRSKVLRF